MSYGAAWQGAECLAGQACQCTQLVPLCTVHDSVGMCHLHIASALCCRVYSCVGTIGVCTHKMAVGSQLTYHKLLQQAATVLVLISQCLIWSSCRFARTAIKIGKLRLILPNGEERHYGGDDASCAPPIAAGKQIVTAQCVVKRRHWAVCGQAVPCDQARLSYAELCNAERCCRSLVQTLAPFNVGCWECWCHSSYSH